MRITSIKLTRLLAAGCVVTGAVSLSACISPQHYVDPTLGETPLSTLKKPHDPQPIQLLFEFRTKGVPNSRATAAVKPSVQEEVAKAGLFSSVTAEPVPSGRKLTISIDNVPLDGERSKQKAFVTGLTFGLDGTTVTDNYVCTFTYLEPGHDPVSKQVHHALYTTVGIEKAPMGLTPVPIKEGVTTVVRQVVDKGLAEIDEASDIAQ